MSNHKRKRDNEEAQAPNGDHRKQKKRRKSGHHAANRVNGTSGDAKVQGEQVTSNVSHGEDLVTVTPQEQGAKSQKKEKRKKDGKQQDSAKDPRREERRAKRESKHEHRKKALGETAAKTDGQKRSSKKHIVEKSGGKLSKPKREKKGSAPKWKLSEAIGGRMLSIDPLFTPEEDCLLIAYENAVCVYSTSSSLLLRKLHVRRSELVSSFAFCPADISQLYISTASGFIDKWNWKTGAKLDSWNTRTSIYFIRTLDVVSTDLARGLVYTVDRFENKRWTITAHRLMTAGDTAKTELRTLLKYEKPITSLRILEEGRLIIATSGDKLLLGISDNPTSPVLKDIPYVWREIVCSEWIFSIDTRIRPERASTKRSKGSRATVAVAVDIVVGGLKGAIFIYEDLLRRLISKEDNSKAGTEDDITPRKLHWHRNAVASVKWSADANYVISGGQETVLIIWQLETGHKQELPHLSADIESIVVSPEGSSYAVRLADNSAMILSTTELRSTFSVAGIQLPATSKAKNTETPFVPTIDAPVEDSLPKQNQYFPTVSSTKANQLLLAVPATTASATSSQHACFLQAFDIQAEQQLYRQALARNKVTTLTMGPEANTIEEPNVTHMQLSHDGMWLATVDEWVPPKKDVDHLAFDGHRIEEEQNLRREVYLKFWAWHDSPNSWELVSRIDNPQPIGSNYPGSVLDLGADPSQVGFATIGVDGAVRMWKPQIRKRHGLDVKGKEGKSLTSWSCRWTTQTPSAGSVAAEALQAMRLAFSHDGSVLAVSTPSSTSVIHTIDTRSGMLRSSLTGLFEGPSYGLGIIDRYLIILSEDLQVWDMVSEEMLYSYAFEPLAQPLRLEKRAACTHLAVDQKHQIFAVAVPEFGENSQKKTTLMSRIGVFGIESSDPLYSDPLYTTLQPSSTTSLLSAPGKVGFYSIDNAAQIRTIMPKQTIPEVIAEPSSKQEPTSVGGLANIYGDGKANDNSQKREILKLTSADILNDNIEDDMRVVSPEKLAEVFQAGSAFALPPVSDLFEKVATLFAGRSGVVV